MVSARRFTAAAFLTKRLDPHPVRSPVDNGAWPVPWMAARRCVDYGKVKVRIGVVGFGGDGFQHFLLRGFLPTLLAGGDSKIIVRSRTLGIDRERFG